jgi:ubiquinone/menaquinone biosynthesis C-methylase UbiE
MSDDSTRFVGTIPADYDRLEPFMFAGHAEVFAQRVTSIRPARILELAAGTGILTRRLRDLLPATAEITATDINPPMLAVARGKFRPGEKVEFLEADATDLPFPDSSFDIVACQFGIMFFPDKDKSYREARRVLSTGGRYLFNVWDSHRYNHFGRIAHEIMAGLFPTDPPPFFRVAFGNSAIDPIKESLISAGFTDIRIDVVSLEKDIPDPEEFAFSLVHGLPIIEQVQSRSGADPGVVVSTLAGALRREMVATGRTRLQAILFEARAQ